MQSSVALEEGRHAWKDVPVVSCVLALYCICIICFILSCLLYVNQ